MSKSKGLPQMVRIMDYIQQQASNEGMDVTSYLVNYADGVTSGYGSREEADEEESIRLSKETPLYPEDVAEIKLAMSAGGFSEKTIAIAIGEFVRDASASQ